MNKSESKYFNTARRMDDALLALLEEKDFEYITVKEICSRAGVHRSTFYLHYETIGDLLSESVEYMHGQFMEQFKDMGDVASRISHCPREELLLLTPPYLKRYLSFIREHRQVYRTALRKPEVFAAQETYKKMFQHIFNPILERFLVPQAERTYRMMFYLSGIGAVIAEWLKGDCADSDEYLIELIERFIRPCEQEEGLS